MMMTTIHRLSPNVHLTPAHVKLSQCYTSALFFQYLDAECSLSLANEQNNEQWCQLDYIWNGNEIHIYVPTYHLCEFLDPNLNGLVFNDLEETLQRLFLQILQQVIEDIFGQFKVKLMPKPIKEKVMVTLEESVCFKLTQNQQEFYQIALAASDANALNLVLQLYQHGKHASQLQASTLAFPFRIQVGQARLSIQEMRTLRLGDIILSQTEKNILNFCWQKIVFLGEQNNTTILVKSNLMENTNDDLPVGIIPEAETEEEVPIGAVESAPEAAEQSVAAAAKPAFSVNQLPVLISFDAGTKHLTFEQLQQLHEGYTFELEKNIDENVDILANGQCIGQGEWVQINERLGVRITHLNLQ